MRVMQFDEEEDDEEFLPGRHRTERQLLDTQGSGMMEPMISPVSMANGSKLPTEVRGESMYMQTREINTKGNTIGLENEFKKQDSWG
jgi:hypothetical protein